MPKVQIVAVTDLGAGNAGAINAADLSAEKRDEVVQGVANDKYHLPPTNCFCCIDGRRPNGGVKAPEGYADPQIAGSEAVSGAAADMMLEDGLVLSVAVRRNTEEPIAHGRTVRVHGDDNKRKAGCGAAGQLASGEAFRANARNADIVAPMAWDMGGMVGLHDHLEKSDVTDMIATGKKNADSPELFDVDAEGVIDTAQDARAEYEILTEDHREKVAIIDLSETAFDEAAFMEDFRDADGQPIEAFVASFQLYKKTVFETYAALGRSERDAARKVMGVILFNIAVSKQLTAEEQGNGEALPVVIIK